MGDTLLVKLKPVKVKYIVFLTLFYNKYSFLLVTTYLSIMYWFLACIEFILILMFSMSFTSLIVSCVGM